MIASAYCMVFRLPKPQATQCTYPMLGLFKTIATHEWLMCAHPLPTYLYLYHTNNRYRCVGRIKWRMTCRTAYSFHCTQKHACLKDEVKSSKQVTMVSMIIITSQPSGIRTRDIKQIKIHVKQASQSFNESLKNWQGCQFSLVAT